MYLKYYLNKGWKYTDTFEGLLLLSMMKDGKEVDFPHTFAPTSYNYIDAESQRAQCVYQKSFFAKEEWKDKRLILCFDGVAQRVGVYINGVNLIIHECDSTPFNVDIGNKINYGANNLITLLVDSRSELNQPPYVGNAPVDTIPFGGVYRDVYLIVKEKVSMNDVFHIAEPTIPPNTKGMKKEALLKYSVPGKIHTHISLSPDAVRMANEHRLSVKQILNEKEISFQPLKADGITDTVTGNVQVWDIDSPTCYSIRTELLFDGVVIDTHVSTIGFRSIAFDQSGFHLNGRKVKIRGIVRHQVYPYLGYAMPESIQRYDAKILKEELHVNAVRCYGGYPSPYFLEECNTRGILVFCEVPGYRNIGDADFKKIHINNIREMIVAGRNHPSVFMWGVRVNGSVSTSLDEDAVKLAHSLDPTRLTAGERLETDMEFAEDVYAYTDTSYSGKGTPLLSKEEVTSDMGRPYIVSGYLGESLPVKPTDSNKRKAKQLAYVAGILDAQAFMEDIAGSFAYCMCDHASLAEYAADDGIVYQGIMDCFRNKKPVAAVFSTQNNPSYEISVFPPLAGDRERWEGVGEVYILTNTQKVRVYRDDEFICEYDSGDSAFPNMKHGPVLFNDFFGDAGKGDDEKSEQVKKFKKLINQMSIEGMSSFLQSGQMMDRLLSKVMHRMSRRQLMELYDNYASADHVYRVEGVVDGKVEAVTVLAKGTKRFLKAEVSSINFIERHSNDVIAVRIHVNDENGQVLSEYAEPVMVETEGEISVIGPKIIPLRGGYAGTYIKSKGIEGEAKLKLSCGELTPIEFSFNILVAPEEIMETMEDKEKTPEDEIKK